MEEVLKVETKINIERSQKQQGLKKFISAIEKLLNSPQFRNMDLVSIKEVR